MSLIFFKRKLDYKAKEKNEEEKVKLITGTMQRSPQLIRVARG
jgi:hypothetical protein